MSSREMGKQEKTKVIFRRYPDAGDIIAIFPELPGTNDPGTCLCYQHLGQHGDCYPVGVIRSTKPATPEQYASLMRELRRFGYELLVLKRIPRNAYEVRRNELSLKYGS